MSISQAIIASLGGSSAPPLPTPQGAYWSDDSVTNWGYVGPGYSSPSYNSGYQFPNSSYGPVWTFTGSEYMETQVTTGFTQLYINLWFYPTATGATLITAQNSSLESNGYTTTLVEINSNGTLIAKSWDNPAITTIDHVSLNTWNHLYLAITDTQFYIVLNGGSQVTQTSTWSRPNPLVLGIGTYSVTNMGNSNRYQGKIAEFRMNSTNTASNFNSTKNIYTQGPLVLLDAANFASYSDPQVVANTQSMGNAGPTLLFASYDFTQGAGTSVQPGWSVSSSNGWSDTITAVTPNWNGTGGLGITVNGSYWGGGPPFVFRDPAAGPSTTKWYDVSGHGNDVTLYNAPAFNSTGTHYYEFSPTSLQYGDANNIGDHPQWSVEVWMYLNATLDTTAATCPVCTVYDDPAINAHPGVINYTLSNNSVGASTNTLKAGFFDGNWRETQALIPAAGAWFQIVGTYDGRFLKTYYNGSLASPALDYMGIPSAGGGKIRIARRWDGPLESQHFFPGRLGLVKIYGHALNDVEIQNSYNDTKATYGL